MRKVSNLATTILSSLVFTLVPMVSHAIGLGNVILHSHLNEPLEADIPIIDLKGVDPSDVIVTVADQQEYEAAGLQPIGWLTSIRFQVIKSEIAGRPVLKLKTKEVVKDPFVDLLIEVKWPNGKLLREYTLLLDPPKSVIPTTRAAQSRQNILPAVTVEEVQSRTRQLETIPGATYGPIAEESLWSIAKSLAMKTNSNIHQTLMAIAEKNPHAFRNGNINCMRSGVVLNLPDKAELEQYSKEQSQSYVTQGKISSHPPIKAPVAKAPQKPLKLVTPIQSLEPAVKLAGKAENQGEAERLNLIEEAIDTLKRSNEDITKKNQSLQDQNQSLEKLLSMKEEEIKKLVEMVKQPMQANENISQGQFAIAVSDIPQKPKEEGLEPAPFANMAPAKPFELKAKQTETPHKEEQPTTIKVDNPAMPPVSPKAISADELAKPKQAAAPKIEEQSEPKGLFGLLLLLGGLSALGIILWKRRYPITTYLQNASNQLSTKFIKQPKLAVSPSSKIVENYGLQFDLDKALEAIADQEKKFKKSEQHNKLSDVDNLAEKQIKKLYEDAQECITYERFVQAEKCLKEILQQKNNEWLAAYKLLEIYVKTEKYVEFEHLYEALPDNLQEAAPEIWSKIETLHQKVKNEKAVQFQSQSSESIEKMHIESIPTEQEYIDLGKNYTLSLEEQDASDTINLAGKDNVINIDTLPPEEPEMASKVEAESEAASSEDIINIETLPADESASTSDDVKLDIQRAQIALAKAYIDMGEYTEAKTILIQLSKEVSGEQAKQVALLLESIS
ncbi:FimV/HubP family polar landmark protein [Candidatus Berkiella aquae]|uniref:FimV N-terminal domain-containing protein n=1 Tax=Candidatus Berkiella aquae TaxID=295108 RepID=A0A0Q9YWE0_9GAMM|nr:FimV/HubP family polar landmark protein [Candidatus Berkiella aquae]MCS5711743.1 hypothetical protein [Candidatus Berkiella aquae]